MACRPSGCRRFAHLPADPRCGSPVNPEAKVSSSLFPGRPRQKELIGSEEQAGGMGPFD